MGKSTLSLFLHALDEFECFSDDLIIINLQNLQIRPMSRYVHIRESAIALMGHNTLGKLTYNKLVDRYQYPLSHNRFNKENKVNGIFILDRKEFANSVSKITGPQVEILNNSYLPYQLRKNVVNAVILSNHTDVWRIEYSTLIQAYQLIKHICDQQIDEQ